MLHVLMTDFVTPHILVTSFGLYMVEPPCVAMWPTGIYRCWLLIFTES